MRPLFLLFLGGLITGCALTGPESNAELTDLDEARERWEQWGLDDYDIDLTRSCFCIGAGAMTVLVRDDTVAAVLQQDSPWSFDQGWWQYIPTVDGLFDLAEEAQKDAFRVDITFSQTHGYPVEISIDWIENAVDDEISYSVSGIDASPDTEILRMAVDDLATLSGGQTISFDGVSEDSRCPHDADCIWAGRAVIDLTLGSGIDTRTISLTQGDLVEGDSDSASLFGVTVTLVDVSPYPAEAGTPIGTGEYHIQLIVESD
ncbi:MAG: hypothetical protein ACI80V_003165 [Rhodothermales bacterium]|jgi:hypothetical protein